MNIWIYYIWFYIFIWVLGIWCLFLLDPLYVCNSAVCDMELQFPWGNLPKEWIKLSMSNREFTPKATTLTSCHSFSTYVCDEERPERPAAWATRFQRREQRKLTDAQLYANEQRRDRSDSQLGTDIIDGLLYRPWKTRPSVAAIQATAAILCERPQAILSLLVRTQSKSKTLTRK